MRLASLALAAMYGAASLSIPVPPQEGETPRARELANIEEQFEVCLARVVSCVV